MGLVSGAEGKLAEGLAFGSFYLRKNSL